MYDKPYLQPNETIAFIIEWGGLILFLALVLSPFLIIRLKRFKPTKWRHIVGAYLGSFAVFLLIEYIGGKIHDDWLLVNFINTGWISGAWDQATLREWLLLLLIWPLSTFYSTKLLYNKFTKKRFAVSLILSTLIFISLVIILFYAMAIALGQIGSKYF